jgi:hypothetical protein
MAGERVFDFFQDLTGTRQADLGNGSAQQRLGRRARRAIGGRSPARLGRAARCGCALGFSATDVVDERGRQTQTLLLGQGNDIRRGQRAIQGSHEFTLCTEPWLPGLVCDHVRPIWKCPKRPPTGSLGTRSLGDSTPARSSDSIPTSGDSGDSTTARTAHLVPPAGCRSRATGPHLGHELTRRQTVMKSWLRPTWTHEICARPL